MVRNNRWNRLFFLIILLLWPSQVWTSEISAMWSNIYRKQQSLEQRFVIMSQMIVLNDRDLIPLLIQSQLDLLLISRNPLSIKERYYHNGLQKLIVKKLGDFGSSGTEDVLFQSIKEAEDNFLKAEAIDSLGKIGAKKYAESLALILRNLNLGITILPSKEETETVAAACITALERMKDPVGFEPVFLAIVGGYTQRVVKPARRSLDRMVDDPGPYLGNILIKADDFDVKKKVLDFAYTSRATEEGKVKIAAAGLSEGLRHVSENIRQMTALSRLRITAASMLEEFGYEDPAIAADLGRMLKLGRTETGDINEVLACLQALGSGRGEESAELLSDHLNKLNKLQGDGITITDQREITQTIRSLAKTGSPLARDSLIQVEFSQWNGAVIREAKAALKTLP